jgi:hypothetical protein
LPTLVTATNVIYSSAVTNIRYSDFAEAYARERTVYVATSSTAQERTIAVSEMPRTIIIVEEPTEYDRHYDIGEEHRQAYASRAITTYDRTISI